MVDFKALRERSQAQREARQKASDAALQEAPPVVLEGRQVVARDAALSGRNVFITGPGGTGKSEVVKAIIKGLRAQCHEVAVTASTGIAAVAIGGMTIHSVLGLGISGNRSEAAVRMGPDTIAKAQERLYNVRTIILEEVSMLTGDYIDMMDWWLNLVKGNDAASHRPFGGYQMVFLGDFLQLPAVIKDPDAVTKKYAFESDAWLRGGLDEVYLNESHRQADPELFRHLCLVRRGIVDPETVAYFGQCVGRKLDDPTKLYGTNESAFQENAKRLAALEGEERVYEASFEGNPKWYSAVAKNCIADEVLALKVGAPVIFLKNDYKSGYVNGMRGRITEMHPDGVMVSRDKDGKEVFVEKASWEMRDSSDRILAMMTQVPVKLAWAVTIHKSQGMTLDRVYVDVDGCFERGQAYVALSRARSLEGLALSSNLSERSVRASLKVVNYYRDLARRMRSREEMAAHG